MRTFGKVLLGILAVIGFLTIAILVSALYAVFRIEGGGADRAARGGLDVGGDGLALVLVARGQHDLGEILGQHGALVGDDVAHTARADDQDFFAHRVA